MMQSGHPYAKTALGLQMRRRGGSVLGACNLLTFWRLSSGRISICDLLRLAQNHSSHLHTHPTRSLRPLVKRKTIQLED